MRKLLAAAVAATAAVTLTACDATGSASGSEMTGLRFMVPTSPGGGYDTTARTIAQTMEETGLASTIEVFNLDGAGGTVALGRAVSERGNGKLVMQMGLGVVGSVYTNDSPSSLADTTPIARTVEEPEIFVVPEDSKYTSIDQLIADWKADPGAMPVGGGSSPGGPDHLAPMLTAEAAGIDPKQVNYIPYDGGGELLAAILGGKVAFGVSGISEYLDQIEAGELRVLAVSGHQRIEGIDAPTLNEAGIDVEFTNWRGIVAPPGISETERKALIDVFTKLHDSPEWKEDMEENYWTDKFLTGEKFGQYIEQQSVEVERVLKELGLA